MPTQKDNRFKLTNASIRDRCHGPAPGELNGAEKPLVEKLYWDTEVRGLCVRARPKSKSFALWKNIKGKPRTVTIGTFPEITAEQARTRAKVLIAEIINGVDPAERKREEAAKGLTFKQARDMHADAMRAKGCSARSIEQLYDETERMLGDWLAKPLSKISRADCAARHKRLTIVRHGYGRDFGGPYVANRVLRLFRACYNTAARVAEGLPTNPSVAVRFNKEKRRQEPIPWPRLAGWRAMVDAITNPVRRDLQLFLLFTGLRSLDARTVRWERVNLGTSPKMHERVEIPPGCLHLPNPKGGADRAFTIPLSGPALDILRRRQLENRLQFSNDAGWAFPARDTEGRATHVQEPKESVYEAGERVGYLPSPHRLRDTFATAAHEAQVGEMDLKILLNHRLAGMSGNVTAGYIRPSVEHLRPCADRVAAFLLERMQAGKYPGQDSARSSVG